MLLRSDRATAKLGFEFARARKRGGVVALVGPLGSGKTTFVRGLARGLGVTLPIQSPTYVLLQVFPLPTHPKGGYRITRLVHADLYRIEQAAELPAELFEYLADPTTLTVIEWAERLNSKLPVEPVWVTFNHRDEQTREVTIGPFEPPKGGLRVNRERSRTVGRRSVRPSEQPS